ncbi:MAG: hypothetical protein AMXMBFR61_07240 [Fimbriimonadales bacterium]
MNEQMSPEELRRWYELEKRLAKRVRDSTKETRAQVVKETYAELFREVPNHPQVTLGGTEQAMHRIQIGFYRQVLGRGLRVLEVGCGIGVLAKALAPQCEHYVALDATEDVLKLAGSGHSNLEFVLGDAVEPDFPPESFDAVISGQVIEHLHPDDIPDHLDAVWRLLRPGGRYLFDTPCGLTGPHDVSRHFDEVATGFHLKEWRYREMVPLLLEHGFTRVRSPMLVPRLMSRAGPLLSLLLWPAPVKIWCEAALERVGNRKARRILAKAIGVDNLWIVATKAERR